MQHVNAWTALYGRLRRAQLTSEHVRKARATWIEGKVAPKTVNNRCQTLRHLFHVLDGERAPTPVDGVKPLSVPVSPEDPRAGGGVPHGGGEPHGREDPGAVPGDCLDRRAAG